MVLAEAASFLAHEVAVDSFTYGRWLQMWGGLSTRLRRALEVEAGVGKGGMEEEAPKRKRLRRK